MNVDKHAIRRSLCQRALVLAERIDVQIASGSYAIRYGTQGGYRFCILGALAFVARTHPALSQVSLEHSTVSEEGETDLFDFNNAPDFVRSVLTLVWDVTDVALIEAAFEGDVSQPFGSRIPLRSVAGHLHGFFNGGYHESSLQSQGDRNLVGQFSYALTLRASAPDDITRYRRILQNVLEHGGLYNPRG